MKLLLRLLYRWLTGSCWHKWREFHVTAPIYIGAKVAVENHRHKFRMCVLCHRHEQLNMFSRDWMHYEPRSHIATPEQVLANYERQKAATELAMAERDPKMQQALLYARLRPAPRWEDQERADYSLESMQREMHERLYGNRNP
jgi:hypothetical protein